MQKILDALIQNQMATGLSAAAILGATLYQLKRIPRILYDLILRSFTIKLSIDSRDSSFPWIEKWLSAQSYAKRVHIVTLRTENKADEQNNNEKNSWLLTPGYGTHWFFWKRKFIIACRSIKDAKDKNGQAMEEIEFRTIGRSQKTLRLIIDEAYGFLSGNGAISIYLWRGWWSPMHRKFPRSIDTLIFKEGQKERIINDLIWFCGAKEWYDVRGIPYRRGYLFDGKWGTGKSSIVLAIAGVMKRPVCVLNLGSVTSDSQLFSAICDAPSNAIILIEDIDCASSATNRAAPNGRSDEPSKGEDEGVTKAGLLNALDGITTPDGRIFIMTTNYPERLDEALIRPGRADFRESFGFLCGKEQQIMANRFYGEDKFKTLDVELSPAEMQAAFMMFPDNPNDAHEYLKKKNAKQATQS